MPPRRHLLDEFVLVRERLSRMLGLPVADPLLELLLLRLDVLQLLQRVQMRFESPLLQDGGIFGRSCGAGCKRPKTGGCRTRPGRP